MMAIAPPVVWSHLSRMSAKKGLEEYSTKRNLVHSEGQGV